MPCCLSKPPWGLEPNLKDSPSPGARSIGDHPAILPATTPAMAAAGPNAELDRDRVRRRDRESGLAGGGGVMLPSPFGVPGIEFSRERDPLRDLGSSS